MTTTLRVVHTTGYRYDGTATSSINEARMIPRADAEQAVLFSRVDISPTAWSNRWTDYFGTSVLGFEVHEPHDEMTIVATSTVDVSREGAQATGAEWSQLADRHFQGDFAEYLGSSALTEPAPGLARLVEEERGLAATPAVLVAACTEAVTSTVRYLPGATDVTTTAAQAWEEGAGVCQDLTHILVGALRAGGVPARYVSGYLEASDAAQAGDEAPHGESHAWVEYWDGAWTPVDPTNPVPVREHHVAVGHGRDYRDVAPLRGVFTGAPVKEMFVDVRVSRLH